MKKRKIILAAVALLALFFIGGTMAYFTDTTTVTNTFTLGNVQISLSEPSYNENAALALMPGAEIDKDPTITNVGASPAYVFIKITEPCYNNQKIFTYTINAGWSIVGTAGTCVASTGVSTAATVYAYGTSAQMTELLTTSGNDETTALFDEVTLLNSLTQADVVALNEWDAINGNDIKIVVDAYGIQSENLPASDSSSVWANFQ